VRTAGLPALQHLLDIPVPLQESFGVRVSLFDVLLLLCLFRLCVRACVRACVGRWKQSIHAESVVWRAYVLSLAGKLYDFLCRSSNGSNARDSNFRANYDSQDLVAAFAMPNFVTEIRIAADIFCRTPNGTKVRQQEDTPGRFLSICSSAKQVRRYTMFSNKNGHN